MIKFILTILLILPHFDFFQEDNVRGIVISESIEVKANAGPGRAYAITCGYVYDAPDIDICLERWLPYEVLVPFFNKQIIEWFVNYPHMTTRFLAEMPEDFMLFNIQIAEVNIGYTYSWWERDICEEG